MLCPAVRVSLDFLSFYFNHPGLDGFCYQKFFYFHCTFFIIILKCCGDLVEFGCKPNCTGMFFPLPNTLHIFPCVFASYPFIIIFVCCRCGGPLFVWSSVSVRSFRGNWYVVGMLLGCPYMCGLWWFLLAVSIFLTTQL